MLIKLPDIWVIILNIGGWLVLQLGLAWAFTRMPAKWFNPGHAWRWERNGRFYEAACHIKRWKDWLPDAADWFHGGFAKSTLAGTQDDYLRHFIRETWRSELCHWLALACAPIFFLWNPCWGDLVITGYALVMNLPCIIAQRYNRARFQRVLRGSG